MSWLWLSFASAFAQSISGLVQKNHISKNFNDSILTGCLFNFLAGVMCLGIGVALGEFAWTYTTFSFVLTLIVSVGYMLSTAAYFEVLRYTDVSLLTIFGSLRSVCTLIGAYALFGEVLNLHQLIGMCLVFLGIVVTQRRHRTHLTARTLALVSVFVLCVGLGQVAERYISHHMNIYLYLCLAYCIPSGALFLIQYRKQQRPLLRKKHTIGTGLIVASTLAVGSVLLMRAIQYAPTATQPSIVSQSRVVITVILAALFLHERTHLRTKLFSAVLCVLGLILLK